MCAAAMDESAEHNVDLTIYQTWLELMQNVTKNFSDDAKREFEDMNGFKAVASIKRRVKNDSKLVDAADIIWSNLT